MTPPKGGRVRRTRRSNSVGGFGETALPERSRFALPNVRIRAYARLRSTQLKAIEDLEAGRLAVPTVIVAARQTAGRGQRGNAWWSDAGSLCATFVLPAAEIAPGQIPLRAGLAVAEVVARCAPRAAVRVKWPNDVIVEDKKIAGVLCERRRGYDVIGIGLNLSLDLRRAPPDVRRGATSLQKLGVRPPTRGIVLQELFRALLHAFSRPDFWGAYESRSIQLGHPIRLRTSTGEAEGQCVGFDDEGRLLARCERRLYRITESDQIAR